MGIRRKPKGHREGGQFARSSPPDDHEANQLIIHQKTHAPRGKVLREKKRLERDIRWQVERVMNQVSRQDVLEVVQGAKEVLANGISISAESIPTSREASLAYFLNSYSKTSSDVDRHVTNYMNFCQEKRIEPDETQLPDMEAVAQLRDAFAKLGDAITEQLEACKRDDYHPLDSSDTTRANTLQELGLPTDLVIIENITGLL